MSTTRKLRIAVAGLGFGAEFVPIYLDHPDVAGVAVCDSNPARLAAVTERFGIRQAFRSLAEVVASTEIDAVHLVTGIPDHARHAIAVLESGKHCACTVPMATSLPDLRAILRARRRAGRQYMMMETAVYTRPFLCARALLERGELGRVQFLRGAHYQDMEKWPPYWDGLPPMWYATHAVSPLLALAGTRAVAVHCFGSGVMRPELVAPYGNPFPVETAIFRTATPALSAEVTRTLFHCARPYMESFVVYGENACYEWQMEDEPPLLFRMSPVVPGEVRSQSVERPEAPDRTDLLPPSVARYTRRFVYESTERHLSFEQGGGHHGSHPHLVHEFVRSIVEGRPPAVDAATAAGWTAAGICAHESAMRGGREISIPGVPPLASVHEEGPMEKMMIGISGEANADRALLRNAGIGWMRYEFPFPFVDRIGGAVSPAYLNARAGAEALVRDGFGLMGIPPLFGYGNWEPGPDGELRLTWHGHSPAYMGDLGTAPFNRSYHDLCAFLARDLKGLVPVWQILNELEIPQFAGPLDLRQACELILACARGFKEVDPSLLLGANPAGEVKAYYLYGYLYRNGDPLDYCGADGYYGSWHPGGAETWDARISELHAMTGKPVLLNEWGFSSVGGVASREEHETGKHVCALKKWHYTWGRGHTPEGQADFVRTVFATLKKHRAILKGAFFYRLDDQPVCGQCHQPDCPAETGWGIVDAQGTPKPAYHAFAQGVQLLRE